MSAPTISGSTTPRTAAPGSLSPAELQSWSAERPDLLVLDVRSAAEFEALHIEGSFNVPLPLLLEHPDELAARLGSDVVLVCQSGVRSEQARQRLAASGVTDLQVLAGGVPGYAAAGGGVKRGPVRWHLERQVRMAAGSLVIAGLAGGRFVSPRIRMVAGVIGTGLTFSAATNTCAMGRALAVMPWNRAAQEPTRESAILGLPVGSRRAPGIIDGADAA